MANAMDYTMGCFAFREKINLRPRELRLLPFDISDWQNWADTSHVIILMWFFYEFFIKFFLIRLPLLLCLVSYCNQILSLLLYELCLRDLLPSLLDSWYERLKANFKFVHDNLLLVCIRICNLRCWLFSYLNIFDLEVLFFLFVFKYNFALLV